MGSLGNSRVLLSVELRVPAHVFERYLAGSPFVVGEQLAEDVRDYVMRHNLGYYPALDFFREREGVDRDLLDAADQISWFVCSLVREEVMKKLRGVFSSVAIAAIQTRAFTMPQARPSQHGAFELLAEHYCPDSVKLNLEVSMFHRGSQGGQMDRWAKHLVCRWLRDTFENVEVTSAEQLN